MAHKQAFIQLTTAAPTADILTAPVAVTRKLTGISVFPSGANAGSFVLEIKLLVAAVDWIVYRLSGTVGQNIGEQMFSNMDTGATKLHAVATGLPAAATVDIGLSYTEE